MYDLLFLLIVWCWNAKPTGKERQKKVKALDAPIPRSMNCLVEKISLSNVVKRNLL